MYIKSVEISNIRSITHFKMDFPANTEAGWHVLIGDNGTGKSSILRAIALGLIGIDEISGIQPDWNDWLRWKQTEGDVKLEMIRNDNIDVQSGKSGVAKEFKVALKLKKIEDNYVVLDKNRSTLSAAKNSIWGGKTGWFSASYGTFRRFTGGSKEMDKLFKNHGYTRLVSHLSLFGKDVALTEVIEWLKEIQFQTLENKLNHSLLDDLKKLINSEGFLPHNTQLKTISSNGVFFVDTNNNEVLLTELSDGFQSALCLTFELMRQLIRVFGVDKVFANVRKNLMKINLPGVVLIDEVDAHLHPTWQTTIGQWFIKYFPNIQFIVTTHSPLVCRACAKGSIWRLAAPGSEEEAGEITGTDKNRLVYGNVLDAYGTDAFGAGVEINSESVGKIEELIRLNKMKAAGKISAKDVKILEELRKIFSTDDTIEF